MTVKRCGRNWLQTALVVGAGALGAASAAGMAAGAMSSQTASRRPVRQVVGRRKSGGMQGMMQSVSGMSEEFADEFCQMAHKTGNAMIRCGRFINKMVP